MPYSIGANEYPTTPPPEGTPITIADLNNPLTYSYGGKLIVAKTNKCYRYAVESDQGKNWSEFYGDGWIYPEANVNCVKIFTDMDQPLHIGLDALTGLFYRFATRNGPSGSGLSKVFKDKIGSEYAPGIDIPWQMGLKEHRGNQENYLIKFMEAHFFLRPQEESDKGGTGYDENGYLSSQEITVKAFKNGNLAETAKTENIPYKGDVVFDKNIVDNRVQLELSGTASSLKIVGARAKYELLREAGAPDQRIMQEADYQFEMCDPILHLSRGDLTLNLGTGEEPASGSIFGMTTGPDNEDSSAMIFSATSELFYDNYDSLPGDFTIMFAVSNILTTTEIIRFSDGSHLKLELQLGVYSIEWQDNSGGSYSEDLAWDGTGWVFIKVSREGGQIIFSENGAQISSMMLDSVEPVEGDIEFRSGNAKRIFDIRVYKNRITEGAFNYYYNDVINNNGNAFLCY